jgi:hypothetical protein
MVLHFDLAQGQINIVPVIFQFYYHLTQAWKDSSIMQMSSQFP